MKRFLLAIQFLTIFPVRVMGDLSEKEVAGSAAVFPVVGALQGLLSVMAGALFMKVFTPDISAGLLVLTMLLFNGGFHMDGLADTFDAMAARSCGDEAADRDRRLAVMKDSSTGAIGVTAVSVTILLKYLLLKNLLFFSSSGIIYPLLFLMPVFSKWVMVAAMHKGTSAKKQGLGTIFISHNGKHEVITATAAAALFSFVMAGLMQYTQAAAWSFALITCLFASLFIFCLISVRFSGIRFGGLTGDTLGATSEISEIIYLLVVAIWLRHST